MDSRVVIPHRKFLTLHCLEYSSNKLKKNKFYRFLFNIEDTNGNYRRSISKSN